MNHVSLVNRESTSSGVWTQWVWWQLFFNACEFYHITSNRLLTNLSKTEQFTWKWLKNKTIWRPTSWLTFLFWSLCEHFHPLQPKAPELILALFPEGKQGPVPALTPVFWAVARLREGRGEECLCYNFTLRGKLLLDANIMMLTWHVLLWENI